MALQKQPININFAQGLDTKTDPFQVSAGKFLSLQNSIFDKIGRLTKRNGYGALGPLPNASTTTLTTFSGGLTALGSSLYAYSTASNDWINKGPITPVNLSTMPVVRNGSYQTYADSATSASGITCVGFVDYVPNGSTTTAVPKYTVIDSNTGQILVAPTVLVNADSVYGAPKVFLLGNFFIIIYTTNTTGYPIDYIAVSATNPLSVSTPVVITTSSSPSLAQAFDAAVSGATLYIGYNTTSGGQAIKLTYLTESLGSPVTPITLNGYKASTLSITCDNNHVYVSFYDKATSLGYTTIRDNLLAQLLAPTLLTPGANIVNMTSVAQNDLCTLYYEVSNSYAYSPSVASNYIKSQTISYSGVVTTPRELIRGLGLASKAFLYNSIPYMLTAYSSDFQPSYFLIDGSGNIDRRGNLVSNLANSNGGGYCTTGLGNVSVNNDTASLTYLYKDLIQSANKAQGVNSPAGIFAQLGVNLVQFNLAPSNVSTAEIGHNLNYAGGYLASYDGVSPTENGFTLYPDNVQASQRTISVLTKAGDTLLGSNTISKVSNIVDVYIGMRISGTNIPTGSVITNILSGDPTNLQIVIDNVCTGTAIGVSLTITSNVSVATYFYQVTYEWADNQGNIFRSAPSIPLQIAVTGSNNAVTLNIPTLKVTYKNNVKIVVYRYSSDAPGYYQVSSIINPILNDPTVDYVTYTDVSNFADINGNNLIYTTGGVLENICPPPTHLLTLFNNRLWVVDSENQNLLWFSKQVIQATCVEMTNLQTLYIAPTTSTQTSTGPITAFAPMDDKLIIWKSSAVGYTNGIGPDATGANSQYSDFVLINSTIGCINQESIVLTPNGLMFQSSKGIWLLGRDLSTSYIGAPVEALSQNATVLSAINVPTTTQVRFTLSSGITLMYDYFFGQWSSFTNIPAISSTVYGSLHTYVNQYGQVFQETPGQYLDNSSPVLMSFTTSWLNLAGLQGYERIYQMLLLGQYITPFKLNVSLSYNYNPYPTQSVLVTPDNQTGPWGSGSLWGGDPSWGGTTPSLMESTANVFSARVFPQIQKCESFQITIDEIFDSSFGQAPGAGLTLSGVNVLAGLKKGARTSTAKRSFG